MNTKRSSTSKTTAKRDIDAHVGARLRQRRTMMGLSQEAVARAVGVTFQQVQKYEKGMNAMNAKRLMEFAAFMNVPVAFFFEGVDSSGKSTGFVEGKAEVFEHNVSDRESLEMMKAFKRIQEPMIRKRVADLVRAVAENKAIFD